MKQTQLQMLGRRNLLKLVYDCLRYPTMLALSWITFTYLWHYSWSLFTIPLAYAYRYALRNAITIDSIHAWRSSRVLVLLIYIIIQVLVLLCNSLILIAWSYQRPVWALMPLISIESLMKMLEQIHHWPDVLFYAIGIGLILRSSCLHPPQTQKNS